MMILFPFVNKLCVCEESNGRSQVKTLPPKQTSNQKWVYSRRWCHFPNTRLGGGVCLSAQPIRDVNHVSCAQSDYLLYMLSIMTLAVSLLELGYFHLYMTMSGKRDVIS